MSFREPHHTLPVTCAVSSDVAIRAHHLAKHYLLYTAPQDRLKQFFWGGRKQFYHEVQALQDVSFEVKRGEALGILGANGSGKSTLLQLICGTLTPSAGEVDTQGRISALLELGTGFNPQFTGRENVFLNGAILGLSHAQVQEKFAGIAQFAGIGEFMDHPVSTYSSGMVVRLAFAVAVASEPDILIVDEALAVGDEAFQRKCFAHIAGLKERGCTLLFVSHSARTVIELCDRALVLDKGELILDTAPKTAVALYQKLLYAPAHARSMLRENIAGLPRGAGADAASTLLGGDTGMQYDPGFTPESTVQFVPHGAVIRHAKLTALDGTPANQLTRRARYRFSYDVEFSSDATDVRLGMMIKTPTDIAVAGGNSVNRETIASVKAGERFRVAFTFSCLLMPGTYYINCGCVGSLPGGEQGTFLHRILDAVNFRVLPEAELSSGGLADFMVEAEVVRVPSAQ